MQPSGYVSWSSPITSGGRHLTHPVDILVVKRRPNPEQLEPCRQNDEHMENLVGTAPNVKFPWSQRFRDAGLESREHGEKTSATSPEKK